MKIEDIICPVCEEHCFKFPGDYDICPICGWENDGVQRAHKDYRGGANRLSVNEAKAVFILSRDETFKSKVSAIIEEYNLRERGIYVQYRGIDHTTSAGKKCYEALSQAHDDFIISLEKLTNRKLSGK